MSAYYNEYEPYAAEWLRNLIKKGLIADGEVDGRSIVDVHPADLRGFDQCHFFAGIGVWSYALRLAGWEDDRSVWTGSCPCQPFSAAGKGKGFDDERHLWPVFHRLISECRPAIVFGEQVASKDGLTWLDAVCTDMEASGYAIGAADLCAAGVGAPHIRQRLWFVGERLGYDHDARLEGQRRRHQAEGGWIGAAGSVATTGELGGVADAELHKQRGGGRPGGEEKARHELRFEPSGCGEAVGMADADDAGRQLLAGGKPTGICNQAIGAQRRQQQSCTDSSSVCLGETRGRPRPTNGFWNYADWLHCRDGKWRPVEPWTFPLAYGAPSRVGRLRAYGNAIVPQVAAEVISAFMEARP